MTYLESENEKFAAPFKRNKGKGSDEISLKIQSELKQYRSCLDDMNDYLMNFNTVIKEMLRKPKGIYIESFHRPIRYKGVETDFNEDIKRWRLRWWLNDSSSGFENRYYAAPIVNDKHNGFEALFHHVGNLKTMRQLEYKRLEVNHNISTSIDQLVFLFEAQDLFTRIK